MFTDNEKKEIVFEYDVDLRHVVEINLVNLEEWNQTMIFKKYFNENKNTHPLDVLYLQTPPPKIQIIL